MTKENYKISKIQIGFYYLLMFLILIWFLVIQFTGINNHNARIQSSDITYRGTFTWIHSDGSKEQIAVPGHYNVPAKETMVITTTLPENYTQSSLAIRSSLQDIRFYIDGVLRTEYSTKDHRLTGKNSASCYVFCPTSSADAGKELRIELTTNTSNYSGVVNEIYSGDKSDIWEYIFESYGLETIIAFFILFAGIITILFSIALGIVYDRKFDMEYLGWCMIMGAVWMLGESKLRQLIVPNPSALGTLCFVMIMLVPIPVLFYADLIQQGRYKKPYFYLGCAAFGNFLICLVLHLTGTADFIETLPGAHVILAVTFFLIFLTFCLDMRKKEYRKNKLVLIGLIIAMLAIAIESISTYFVVLISGLFIGVGMLILLFINIIRTIKNVHTIEMHRQKEELLKRNRQMEKISLQMMQTLSTTIEAKDEYTRGHSHRVAEYSALIAQEMGWNRSEIVNLRHAAHLHDIGKVGIPDIILNKPSRLTNEEYAVIKEHTVIGAEILKNVSIINHVTEVARSHHERYDGHGYPDGLKGEEIPIHARIVAVADSYDAMNSRRIYRNSLPKETIYEEIRKNRGTQFDPEIADIFLRLMDENRLTITDTYLEIDDEPALPGMEFEISNFISNVMNTMKSQEEVENFDLLTGLPMRNTGQKMIAQLMQEHNGCLIFMDMDNLKKINDIYGHKAGDRALKALGALLSEHIGNSVGCRFGGDEFLLFVPDAGKNEISELMETLFSRFDSEKKKDFEIRVASISAGLCMCTKGDSFDECSSKADKALYYVKRNGKHNFFFYQQMGNTVFPVSSVAKDLSLVAKVLRNSGNYSGALNLNYREFSKIYEYINQLGERHKYHCFLVMVTMETAPDSMMYIENIEQALEYMEEAIRHKIRKIDVCTRYSAMQYLIILFEPDESQIPKVMDRIFIQYYKLYDKHNFIPKYEYLPVNEHSEETNPQNTSDHLNQNIHPV